MQSTGWRSSLRDKLSGINLASADKNTWSGVLNSLTQQGVKRTEIAWSGLDEFLALSKGKVTRESLIELLDKNAISLSQTVYSDEVEGLEDLLTESDLDVLDFSYTQWQVRGAGKTLEIGKGIVSSADDARAYGVRYFNGHIRERNSDRLKSADTRRYSGWVVPGGTKYRELLVKLPASAADAQSRLETNLSTLSGLYLRRKLYADKPGYQELLKSIDLQIKTLSSEVAMDTKATKQGSPVLPYKSRHWDEDNVVVHVRFDLRKDADGKSVLFVQEIQSDWGQDARHKGLGRELSFSEPRAEFNPRSGKWIPYLGDKRVGNRDYETENEALEALDVRLDDHSLEAYQVNGVPEAPFIGDTRQWVAVGIKAALRYAVENNVDSLAFANGEQVANVFDLRKSVAAIEVWRTSETTFNITTYGAAVYGAENNPGRNFIENVHLKALPDHIGSKLAEQCKDLRVHSAREFVGDELAIGGHGMVSFYDSIIPSVAKDVVKQLTGEKLIDTTLFVPRANKNGVDRTQHKAIKISESMRQSVNDGVPMFRVGESASAIKVPAWEVKAIVAEITSKWTHSPAFTVVNSASELPFDADVKTQGAYHAGRIYLVAENLRDREMVEQVIAHEAVRHYGFASLLGDERRNTMRTIYNDVSEIRVLADAWIAKAQKRASTAVRIDVETATEEVLADIPPAGMPVGVIDRLQVGVLRFMRKIGFLIRLTTADVKVLLEESEQAATSAAFRKAQRTTALGFSGAIPAFKSDETRFREEQTWYFSEMRKVIADQMGNSVGSAELLKQVRAWAGAGKFKQDELHWSGLEEFLSAKDGKVTKTDVLSFLSTHATRVEELVLSKPEVGNAFLPADGSLSIREVTAEDRAPQFKYVIVNDGDCYRGWGNTHEEAILDAYAGNPQYWDLHETKYGAYALPGGDNYKELLITLPAPAPTLKIDQHPTKPSSWALVDEAGCFVMNPRNNQPLEWSSYELAQVGLTKHDQAIRNSYQSKHWNPRNIVAHVRFNDRVSEDGKRVLFVEEIQSDWAQDARRNGVRENFSFSMPDIHAVRLSVDDFFVKQSMPEGARRYWLETQNLIAAQNDRPAISTSSLITVVYENGVAKLTYTDDTTPFDAVTRCKASYHSHIEKSRLAHEQAQLNKVVDGPFINKTDAWVSLAVKRVLHYAAANNYDTVAFVNGQQACNRYDLSKQVDAIRYQRDGDAIVIQAPRDGYLVLDDIFTEKSLESVVGKHIADQIINGGQSGVISGDNLRVGGDGMRAFYDDIVPKVVSKTLRKISPVELKQIQLNVNTTDDLTNAVELSGYTQRHLDRLTVTGRKDLLSPYLPKQLAFDVTDEMRAAVLNGLPLFKVNDSVDFASINAF